MVKHDISQFLPLKPTDHHILAALLEQDQYGYAIAKAVARDSEGRLRVEAGNLHRHLQKLMRQDLVRWSGRRPVPDLEDERRRYYAITALGRRVWAADIERMEALVRSARARAAHRSAPRPRGAS